LYVPNELIEAIIENERLKLIDRRHDDRRLATSACVKSGAGMKGEASFCNAALFPTLPKFFLERSDRIPFVRTAV
jgi:hypothetical protein